MYSSIRVLIAGIGGASLGTEILKSLRLAGGYTIFGCDISPYAYGHYQEGVTQTFVVDRAHYAADIHAICRNHEIAAVIPGGEEPMLLLTPLASEFQATGVHIVANNPAFVAACSNKALLFERLEQLQIPIPRTLSVTDAAALEDVAYPCVIKPATGTGGSSLVFLAANRTEATLYVHYLLQNAATALLQEYISEEEGEFTVGVLSLADGRLVGSIALRRLFHTKLSVAARTKAGLISSGYSQGVIDAFPDVQQQAERIVLALGSTGPANVQGRLRNGIFIPFEINPRFSASTYLRALAGFNEIDLYVRHLLEGREPTAPAIRAGYYLRSLVETYVPREEVRH